MAMERLSPAMETYCRKEGHDLAVQMGGGELTIASR